MNFLVSNMNEEEKKHFRFEISNLSNFMQCTLLDYFFIAVFKLIFIQRNALFIIMFLIYCLNDVKVADAPLVSCVLEIGCWKKLINNCGYFAN